MEVPAVQLERLYLPSVLPPLQMPKLKSMELAFPTYERAEDYSSSEVRIKHLWIKLGESAENPDDLLFCRVLANAPDQLFANNNQDQNSKNITTDQSAISVLSNM
ncbi:MAG: hypothetical protein ACI9UV_001937 [Algoriphagus sp.]|jgi:hypothetical protein|tara:strand:- start:322 stop:636 length:315 start_codon:yes stop_codon:yes gene_type:complete